MNAVHWVNKCRGAREPRSGALLRMLGCLEMRNEWRFRARPIKGVPNTLADSIPRWTYDESAANPKLLPADKFLRGDTSSEDIIWALIDLAAVVY